MLVPHTGSTRATGILAHCKHPSHFRLEGPPCQPDASPSCFRPSLTSHIIALGIWIPATAASESSTCVATKRPVSTKSQSSHLCHLSLSMYTKWCTYGLHRHQHLELCKSVYWGRCQTAVIVPTMGGWAAMVWRQGSKPLVDDARGRKRVQSRAWPDWYVPCTRDWH